MTKKVLLHVARDGTTKITAEGYIGGTCMDATEAFEDLFSNVVKEREATGECVVNPDYGEKVTR